MRKLYEIFKVLKVQKRIVSAETIRGNTVYEPCKTTMAKSLIKEKKRELISYSLCAIFLIEGIPRHSCYGLEVM